MKTPEKSILAQMQWTSGSVTEEQATAPNIVPTHNLNIGFIGTRNLFLGLEPEVNLFCLSASNYSSIIKHISLDFILVEPTIEPMLEEWLQFHEAKQQAGKEFLNLCGAAAETKTPIVMWQTTDFEYSSLFEDIITQGDYIYCCDPKATQYYSNLKLRARTLLPAVQPRLYNPYRKPSTSTETTSPKIVCDGLGDLIKSPESFNIISDQLENCKLSLYDSHHTIFRSKLNDTQPSDSISILGTVSQKDKQELLKTAQLYLEPVESIVTDTKRNWLNLEAAASRCLVITTRASANIFGENGPLITETIHELISLTNQLSKDELSCERYAHLSWRNAVLHHSFENRIKSISEDLNLTSKLTTPPKATLVMPTIRPEFVKPAVKQFKHQSYANKELVIVFNDHHEEFLLQRQHYANEKDIRVIYLPKENHAGACMNTGIAHASGEYVFRYDDDDIYGENYILDMMLHLRASNADFIGKPLKFFILDEKKYLRARPKMLPRYLHHFLSEDLDYDKISISGSTISGKTSVFLQYPYPDNFGAADTAWYHLVNDAKLYGLTGDKFNAVFWRRSSPNAHTWNMRARTERATNNLTCEDLLV